MRININLYICLFTAFCLVNDDDDDDNNDNGNVYAHNLQYNPRQTVNQHITQNQQ